MEKLPLHLINASNVQILILDVSSVLLNKVMEPFLNSVLNANKVSS